MAKKLARVLVSFHDGDLLLSPNDLVLGETAVINAHEKSGLVDGDKGAVAYCKSQDKAPIDIIGEGVVVESKQAAELAAAELAAAELAAAEAAAAEAANK
ncbi:MAG TPA: hypothetical protein VIO56_06705 [Methylotenera sp.]